MKKNSTRGLIGLTVMVQPHITNDPAQRKGQTGKIVAFFPEREIITVQFKDRYQAVYLSTGLLTLQPNKMIFRALLSGLIYSGDDCKTMLKIYQLSAIKRYTKALQLAVNDNLVQFYCTVTCRQWIDLGKQKKDQA